MSDLTTFCIKQGRAKATDIRIRGAHQNNLKHIDLDIHPGSFNVITGPSGSGKSSLAFDTLYAEGQRRYVETFSAYARQFLERCDRPKADLIDGVPPAIAIEQKNTVRTSRSTVGTMTELNDHIKLLFARQADLFCPECGSIVRDMAPSQMFEDMMCWTKSLDNPRVSVAFIVRVPTDFDVETAKNALSTQGYTHILKETADKDATLLSVAADRFRPEKISQARGVEAFEKAMAKTQNGRIEVSAVDASGIEHVRLYAKGLTCAQCNRTFKEPTASRFSFNTAVGACSHCRGFGKTLDIDMNLVIPDQSLTLQQDAIVPWKRTGKHKQCLKHLLACAKRDGISVNTPFENLTQEEKRWVIEGEDGWIGNWDYQWFGIRRWFAWVESQAGYKIGMRMILSRYRTETICSICNGGRLKPESLFWRVGSHDAAQAAVGQNGNYRRFEPAGFKTEALSRLSQTPGLTVQDLMQLPVTRLQKFFAHLKTEAKDAACLMVIEEIVARLNYLCDVGLGYLTLGRQSRTLSGGEVQRVNLTTALGTNLVDSLFVLDEPSVGLHPRDMDRVNAIISKLKNTGNTLVVVEHDPQVMLAADRIIDMGPGAGQNGGQIVFDGAADTIRQADSLTGLYLSGQLHVDRHPHIPEKYLTQWAGVQGAAEHNLKNIDFTFPLHALTSVTGVSGSGKSTLVGDVLVPALRRKLRAVATPGKHTGVTGAKWFTDVVFVDQSAIGANARSNPVLYIGAFDAIRQLFAQTQVSIDRGYDASTFSFNTGEGRCPTCSGAGFEVVEMQFLSDIHIECETCHGTRYRPETLEVKINLRDQGEKSIADVLNMTADEALSYFIACKDIEPRLTALVDVGLGYMKLGQSLSTLSGGEAQRLKLAEILAQSRTKKSSDVLYVFDEPTTGLHFDDVEKLLGALRRLIDAGQTVLVVEHNLDIISASDWIVDLGPEGGDDGGEIVVAGTPETVMKHPTSYTAKALKAYVSVIAPNGTNMSGIFSEARPLSTQTSLPGKSLQSVWRKAVDGDLGIFGAREHNLKNIDVVIPKKELTVVTGVSGSGKSTLAFGIVFSEGQRRYLDSLNAYARSIAQPPARPDVERVVGIAPTVAIEQRTSRGGRKSTVATMTEIQHFLRLLYVKLGIQHCPKCHVPVTAQSMDSIIADIMTKYRDQTVTVTAPVVVSRKGEHAELVERLRKNFGAQSVRVDGKWVPTDPFKKLSRWKDHTIELPCGTLVIEPQNESLLKQYCLLALTQGQGNIQIISGSSDPQAKKPSRTKVSAYSTKRACPKCGESFPEPEPRLFSFNSKIGWCPECLGLGLDPRDHRPIFNPETLSVDVEEVLSNTPCPHCAGTRLNRVARNVLFENRSICEITALSVNDCLQVMQSIHLTGRSRQIGEDAIKEIISRLEFLKKVGLGYMNLDRDAPSLSGGESQRIRLASQLGSTLQGVCYVLDEPTIGLHARDNALLIDTLTALKNKGNTVIVVEHDEEMILRADHIVDIGPGAGSRGGELLVQGSLQDLQDCSNSITAHMLKHPLKHSGQAVRPTDCAQRITLKDVNHHNIEHLDVAIPLGRLVVLTGVSGSGKSTLAREVLLANLVNPAQPQYCTSISGREFIDRVLEVDQTPIGKTPRSCPATYIGVFNKIRDLFAATNEAQERGYAPGRFSFNKDEGRCPFCEGRGEVTVEMSFLPDVKVCCEVCKGMRFNEETLAVKWHDQSIGDVLNLSVDDALELFKADSKIAQPLSLMQDVGLGYLRLGQPSTTLSGGEAQRIKLVSELSKSYSTTGRVLTRAPKTFYILDEPTVGLHMADVEKLLKVLHKLVDAGHSVLVIEHNLDVIAQADEIIDLGPEGGPAGGTLVGQGAPSSIAQLDTPTGRALKAFLSEHMASPTPSKKQFQKGDFMTPQFYRVGGYVRDELLRQEGFDIPSGDTDWVVVGATPQWMTAQGFIPVGNDFPVFLHPKTHEEYALARTERKSGRGYHGFHFYADADVTLEDDLKRRDLTINAMAMDDDGNIFDPYGGKQDLKQRTLRHVSEAFVEDPVRILRLARFAARFPQFCVAKETRDLARLMVNNGETDALVAERVFKELSRGFAENCPRRMIEVLLDCGYWQKSFREIEISQELFAQIERAGQMPNHWRIVTALVFSSSEGSRYLRQLRADAVTLSLCEMVSRLSHKALAADAASDYFDVLANSDVLRRPERFEEFIRVLESMNPSFDKDKISEARRAFERVNAAEIAQAQTRPSDIGPALLKARREAVEKALMHHP